MEIGEPFALDVPEPATAKGRVVWNSGRFYGCEFGHPISQAAVSAALLRSDPQPLESTGTGVGLPAARSRSRLLYPELNFVVAVGLGAFAWLVLASAAYVALR